MSWLNSTTNPRWSSAGGYCAIAYGRDFTDAAIGIFFAGLVFAGIIAFVICSCCCKRVIPPLRLEDVSPYAQYALPPAVPQRCQIAAPQGPVSPGFQAFYDSGVQDEQPRPL
jgi:hypothetical protein